MHSAKLIALLATLILTSATIAQAQQPTKVPRIGYLSSASASDISFRTEPFRQGLREIGYVEGKNIVIEYRSAEGQPDRLPALAAELVDLKVDIIVTAGPINTRFAKQMTTTIPIVMTQDSDPVANGFVASLARPGGNITGLATLAPELSGKRLELLKEIIPKLSRVATLGLSTIPGYKQALMEIDLAARSLGVKIQNVEIQKGAQGIEAAFLAARKGRAQGMLVLNSPPNIDTRVAQLAVKEQLPAIYFNSAVVKDGGLMSYGASLADLDRRAATYVDKILKGAKPADLPVEQPIKFEFIVNLKAATQIGLTVPPNVLVRADRVIR